MTTTPPRINPRLGAAKLRAPAASREDSRPQAILKLQPCNSFDYRVRYEQQLTTYLDVSFVLSNTLFEFRLQKLAENLFFIRPTNQSKRYFIRKIRPSPPLSDLFFAERCEGLSDDKWREYF